MSLFKLKKCVILEFQHKDVLSPQRRMGLIAENTLVGAGEGEDKKLNNWRPRLDPDNVGGGGGFASGESI